MPIKDMTMEPQSSQLTIKAKEACGLIPQPLETSGIFIVTYLQRALSQANTKPSDFLYKKKCFDKGPHF